LKGTRAGHPSREECPPVECPQSLPEGVLKPHHNCGVEPIAVASESEALRGETPVALPLEGALSQRHTSVSEVEGGGSIRLMPVEGALKPH
jgi:hypothetical protein